MSYRITKTEYHVAFYDGTHPTPFTATVEVDGGQATGVFDCHPPHCLWEDMSTLADRRGVKIEWFVRVRDGSVIDDECGYKYVAWANYWAGEY